MSGVRDGRKDVNPLRVLFLITDLGKGGAERFLLDLCRALKRRGDVELLIGALYDNNGYHELSVGLTVVQLEYQTFSLTRRSDNSNWARLLGEFKPDVALLDVRMPKMTGLEAAVAIRSEFPDARLIALTTYGGGEDVRRALATGVRAYLTKDVLHDELLNAIRSVNQGHTYLPKDIAAVVAAQEFQRHLSEREVEVLELIVQGHANKQIAYSLNIAEATAKNHVKSILAKLGVQDRTQAATAAIQRGIVHL